MHFVGVKFVKTLLRFYELRPCWPCHSQAEAVGGLKRLAEGRTR